VCPIVFFPPKSTSWTVLVIDQNEQQQVQIGSGLDRIKLKSLLRSITVEFSCRLGLVGTDKKIHLNHNAGGL
jgi:hypothetical protein